MTAAVRALTRPTKAQYERALELYRAGLSAEEIADAAGLALDVVEQLIEVGWPAEDGPELASFRSSVQDQLVRIRTSQLAWALEVAESARATAPLRRKSAESAARIEQALLASWQAKVGEAIKSNGGRPPADPAELAMPITVTRSLKALRDAQDPSVDQKIAALFEALDNGGDADSGNEETRDGYLARLARLTPEEQEEYWRLGKWPTKQQRLPGVE